MDTQQFLTAMKRWLDNFDEFIAPLNEQYASDYMHVSAHAREDLHDLVRDYFDQESA